MRLLLGYALAAVEDVHFNIRVCGWRREIKTLEFVKFLHHKWDHLNIYIFVCMCGVYLLPDRPVMSMVGRCLALRTTTLSL